MSNALLHKVEVVAETVETVQQMRDAIAHLAGDTALFPGYRVELLSETLSDGSVACEVRIRLAERV